MMSNSLLAFTSRQSNLRGFEMMYVYGLRMSKLSRDADAAT